MARQTILAALALLIVAVMAQDDTSFQCGVPDDDNLKEISDTNFDTIQTHYKINWLGGNRHLMPQKTNWHIYAIPDGEVPRYSSVPEGFVKPKISGSTLEFPAQEDSLKDLGYSKGDKIKAAVNLFIPVSQLRNIRVSGVDESVEIIVTDELLLGDITNSTAFLPTINIRVSGVDSRLYVNTPYSKVKYTGSGVDNTAIVEAATGSSVDLSGVDQSLSIKSDFLDSVKVSGVDQYLLIEGTYGKIRVSGVDGQIRVNGEKGCNTVDGSGDDYSGVDNRCKTTEETVTVPTLACLAESKVIYAGTSTGAIVGIVIGVLAVVALCIGGCGAACGCFRSRRSQTKQAGPKAEIPTGSWVEAEVIEVDPVHQMVPDPEQATPLSEEKGTPGDSTDAKVY
jgi:hypothetical protein